MKNRARKAFVTLLIAAAGGAVPLSAFADSCPDKIVVGHEGGYDQYAYFNSARIASAIIPTGPGPKYTCTFEGHNGMVDQAHGLSANELIQSVGSGWQKAGDAYTCTQGRDCSFVIQKN